MNRDSRFLKNLYQELRQNSFTDLYIFLDGQEFKVHQAVVSAASPVLHEFLRDTFGFLVKYLGVEAKISRPKNKSYSASFDT